MSNDNDDHHQATGRLLELIAVLREGSDHFARAAGISSTIRGELASGRPPPAHQLKQLEAALEEGQQRVKVEVARLTALLEPGSEAIQLASRALLWSPT